MRKGRLACLLFLVVPAAPLVAGNLLQNRSFDTDLFPWSTPSDSTAIWDSNGRGAAGSALASSRYVVGNAVPDASIYQCVAVSAGHPYAYGASFFVPGGVAATQEIVADVVVDWYSGASCGGAFIRNEVRGRRVLRDNWIDVQSNATAPAGSVSAKVFFGASGSFVSPTAEPIEVNIDDAYFFSDQTCATSAGNLCLGARFRVYGDWAVPDQGRSGYMSSVPVTADSGLFWFFEPNNLEMFVKVLDACVAPYNHYWVFASGLTNVQVALYVDETVSGETREYDNPAGTAFPPIQDTLAFATCP